MSIFNNPWGHNKSSNNSGYPNATSESGDQLLSGQRVWKQSANEWKGNGMEAADYSDPNAFDDMSLVDGSSIVEDNRRLVRTRGEITVVIDPGHGIGSTNVGAALIKGYEYKVKDATTGKVKTVTVDNKEVDVTEKNDTDQLPQYVIDDIKAATFNETTGVATKSNWVIKAYYHTVYAADADATKAQKETEELKNKLERVLVWHVGQELISVLKTIGYTVRTTRESVIDGMSTSARMKMINNFEPDYVISLHGDGATNYTKTGAHSQYRANNSGDKSEFTKAQKEFAEDIITGYGNAHAVTLLVPSVVKRNDIGVLAPISTPHIVFKTLLEMGFASNPDDYNTIFDNKHEIARQIASGLEIHVNKNFAAQTNTIIGFRVKGNKVALYKNPIEGGTQNNTKTMHGDAIYLIQDLPSPPAY